MQKKEHKNLYDDDDEVIQAKNIEMFDNALIELEKHLKPLLQLKLKEVLPNLTSLERAKLNISMAYTVYTLFYSMSTSSVQ